MTTINAVGNGLKNTTGSGKFVGDTSPTLVTPTLGVATATSLTFGGSTLNTYTETTWTPVLSDGTNNATTAAAAATVTKIGRENFCHMRLGTSSLGSVSGNIRITGLPSTAAAFSNGYYVVGSAAGAAGLAVTAGVSVTGFIAPGTNYIVLQTWDDTGGTTSMQSTEWSADGDLALSFSYIS